MNFTNYRPERGDPDDGERETLTQQASYLVDNLKLSNSFLEDLNVMDIIPSKDINLIKVITL